MIVAKNPHHPPVHTEGYRLKAVVPVYKVPLRDHIRHLGATPPPKRIDSGAFVM